MPSTAVAILASHLGVAEDNTKELLDALENAPTLSDEARAELLEKLIAAEQFSGGRQKYSSSVATPKLSEAVRLERGRFATATAKTAAPDCSPQSVVYLRHGSLFHNFVRVFKLAKFALTSGHGTLLFIGSDDRQATKTTETIDLPENARRDNPRAPRADS